MNAPSTVDAIANDAPPRLGSVAPRAVLVQSLAFERCARLSFDLAERARCRPKRGKQPQASQFMVCDLCRQSIYWSLRALSVLRAATSPAVTPVQGVTFDLSRSPDVSSPLDVSRRSNARSQCALETLVRDADPAMMAKAAGSEVAATTLVAQITDKGFVQLAALEVEESARLAGELLPFARNLLQVVERRQWDVDRRWFRRALLAVIVFCSLILATLGTVWGLEAWELRTDLAKGRPWTTSTLYPSVGGCSSPLQDCPSKPGFFFHSDDEIGPWIEFDLGSVQDVSGARIENRTDCCKERAIPMIVEVSVDRKKWKEVSRQNQVFDVWKPGFATEKARYVRLRTEGLKVFHLNRVRIFP